MYNAPVAQLDQRLHCSLPRWNDKLGFYYRKFKTKSIIVSEAVQNGLCHTVPNPIFMRLMYMYMTKNEALMTRSFVLLQNDTSNKIAAYLLLNKKGLK